MPDWAAALAGVGRAGRASGRALLDLLLPSHCLACDAPVPEPGAFCDDCAESATFLHERCCESCGLGLDRGRQCGACLLTPPPWRRARAALRYDAAGKRVVLPLKYGDRVDLAAPLGAMMARAGARLLDEAETLVPVPLHRGRLRMRRYNQAALLAWAVGRRAGRPVAVDALLRVRATRPLGALSAPERAQTVAGAFVVRTGRERLIAGRRVLLIDDVLTSGATAGGCTAALLAAGARSVDVLVAARVGRAFPAPGETGSEAASLGGREEDEAD